MRRTVTIALTVAALAATASAQAMRDFTVQWPVAQEAEMLAAFARHYPQSWPVTLADSSTATLAHGLTVCVPANAADAAAGVCAVRDTTLPERRTILRRQLRAYMRELYLAKLAGDAAEAARATALGAAAGAVPVEP